MRYTCGIIFNASNLPNSWIKATKTHWAQSFSYKSKLHSRNQLKFFTPQILEKKIFVKWETKNLDTISQAVVTLSKKNLRAHMYQRENSKLYKWLSHHSLHNSTTKISLSKIYTKLDLIRIPSQRSSSI